MGKRNAGAAKKFFFLFFFFLFKTTNGRKAKNTSGLLSAGTHRKTSEFRGI